MERTEAIEVTGLREYDVYTRTSGGPVWRGLASSPVHAMDRYVTEQVDSTYSGYTAAIDEGEPTTLDGLSSIGGTVWGVLENTEIYAEPHEVAVAGVTEAHDPPERDRVDEQTIEQAVRDAEDAFWAKIVEHFPSATHGDLDPLVVSQFNEVARAAVKSWVNNNVPRHYVAVVFDVSGMTDDEKARLAMEASVQGESNEEHPGAEFCTIQTNVAGGLDDLLDNLPEGWGEF